MFGGILALGAGLALSLAPPQSAAAPAPAPDLHPIEARVVERTNSQRARFGLPPLSVDMRLVTSARKHAAWMTISRSLVHTTQSVGENIAMGQSSSADVIQSWMNSSGHRANILNPRYTRIGVAAFRTPGGTIYWCQQFLQ
jgi:uncharacterized protein YkwD